MAKSLVFLAHMRGAASDFVEYFSTKEIMACGKSILVKENSFTDRNVPDLVSENELFRKDTMSSKLFKYYSKIVGVPYIFHTLARVIKELEIVTRSTVRNLTCAICRII